MEKILLTTRIRNGDRKAFDELCGRYYAMLVSYARLFMKDDWACLLYTSPSPRDCS